MGAIFQTETIHDLPLHKEFNRAFARTVWVRNLLLILTCFALLVLTNLFTDQFVIYCFLIASVTVIVIRLILENNSRNINYRRMLLLNNGNAQHLNIDICHDGIHCTNLENNNKLDLRYDLFRYIVDTQNLLVLVMPYNQAVILDKHHVQGGTVEELTKFLLDKCPNIKRKRVRKPTLGTWIGRITAVIYVITLIFALFSFSGISPWAKLTGKLHNGMSYSEMANKLAPLGITISDRSITDLEAFDRQYKIENGNEYYDDNRTASKISDLLCWEGCGIYDEESDELIPSTSGIYWLDLDVLNDQTSYLNFMTRLCAMNEELTFSNVQEQQDQTDPDAGTGIFSFEYTNQIYTLETNYLSDSFDLSFLYDIGKILRDDQSTKNLYCAEEDNGVLLYYGEARNVRRLSRITGISFALADGSSPLF